MGKTRNQNKKNREYKKFDFLSGSYATFFNKNSNTEKNDVVLIVSTIRILCRYYDIAKKLVLRM